MNSPRQRTRTRSRSRTPIVQAVPESASTSDTTRSALDAIGTAIMMIDRDFTVTFANAATMALLGKHEAVMQEQYPGFEAERIVGTCIDIFHANPQRIRKLLSDPRNLPHRADIRVGPITFELYVTGMLDGDGALTGHCLEWQDVTEARAKADEAARLRSMVESANAYFMITDRDLKITYANPAVVEMFRKYEREVRQVFPGFSVDALIGTNIDVFHKNPRHQRALLADPSRLPFRTEVKVGDLEFGITACALFDDRGNHIGSAVEWLDLNDRAQYRREVDKLYSACQRGELSYRGPTDELAAAYQPLMQNINEIIDAIVAPITTFKHHLERVAKGDLTAKIHEQFAGDHAILANSLNETLDSLNETLVQVNRVAETVGAGSREVSDSAQALSQGATEQASSLQQITSTMHSITEQTKQNAEHATVANELSKTARSTAVEGDDMMKSMVSAMGDIDQSSQNIRKIIKVIDEIAFQTNLLALNAAVEAARAGVHGKGFAVVAEEVRSLAARSAQAAKETTEMIENSIENVEQGTEIAQRTAGSLAKIVEDVGKVTDLVAEIAAASNEQARGIAEINEGLSQVDQVTQTNTASAEQSAAAATELSGQAQELNRRLEKFTLQQETSLGQLDNLPPEVVALLEQLMAQRGLAAPSANGRGTQRAAAPSTSPSTSRAGVTAQAAGSTYQPHGPADDPANIIALNDAEFGKY